MSDITKCMGANCDLKMTCYRFTAMPSMDQTYFFTEPIKNGKCEMYWGTTEQSIYDQLKNL